MDLICINDYFSPEARQVYEEYGIVTPYLNGVYSVREVVITRYGTGLLLNELVNPKMYCYNIGEVEMWGEVNWAVSRFRNIDGTEINVEQLKQKESQYGSLQHNSLQE